MGRKLIFSNDEESNETVKRYEKYLSGQAGGYFDVEELEDIIEFYLRNGLTEDSLQALELGFKLHPNSSELKLKRAKTYLATGDNQSAIQLLDSLADKDEYEATLLRMQILLRLGRNEEAHLLATRLWAQGPEEDADNICLDIASVYSAQQEWGKALSWLHKGDSQNSQNTDLLFELAFTYEQQNAFPQAIATYNRIIDIDPYITEAWFDMGQAYYAQQNYNKALEAYEFALTINEKDSLTLLQKAHTLFQLDRFEEAIEPYKEYGKISGDLWQTSLFLGECYENMGEYDQAVIHYENSIDLYPENYDALIGIGICLLELRRYELAQSYLQKAISIQEDSAEACTYFAEALTGSGQLDEAIRNYKHSLRLNPSQTSVLVTIGQYYYHREAPDVPTALSYFLQAREQDPEYEYINAFIAACYFTMGEEESGQAHLAEALSKDAEAAQIFRDNYPQHAHFLSQNPT